MNLYKEYFEKLEYQYNNSLTGNESTDKIIKQKFNKLKLKTCKVCKCKKSIELFELFKKRGKIRVSDTCIECEPIKPVFQKVSKSNIELEGEGINEQFINYLAAKRKENYLRTNYRINLEDYKRMLKEQGGVCKICGIKEPTNVDHCHITEKVRGLLCGTCNVMLGMAKDNINILASGIRYLEDNN